MERSRSQADGRPGKRDGEESVQPPLTRHSSRASNTLAVPERVMARAPRHY